MPAAIRLEYRGPRVQTQEGCLISWQPALAMRITMVVVVLLWPVSDRGVRWEGGYLGPLAGRVQVLDLTPPTQQRLQQRHHLQPAGNTWRELQYAATINRSQPVTNYTVYSIHKNWEKKTLCRKSHRTFALSFKNFNYKEENIIFLFFINYLPILPMFLART